MVGASRDDSLQSSVFLRTREFRYASLSKPTTRPGATISLVLDGHWVARFDHPMRVVGCHGRYSDEVPFSFAPTCHESLLHTFLVLEISSGCCFPGVHKYFDKESRQIMCTLAAHHMFLEGFVTLYRIS